MLLGPKVVSTIEFSVGGQQYAVHLALSGRLPGQSGLSRVSVIPLRGNSKGKIHLYSQGREWC